ncbi:MAG: phosphoenolpyruvate carboxykinase (ATP), partial [Deltaproteobacteria bacterium]
MGYTSKLAGTETGVVEPVSVFSRFFGQPFMPRNPDVYAHMLGDKLRRHGTRVYLVNTGWTGGPYGQGRRIDIGLTRTMVSAALDGSLADVPARPDPIFKVMVPEACPGIGDTRILRPESNWTDKSAYEQRARRLAGQFAEHFLKAFGGKDVGAEIRRQCPGL